MASVAARGDGRGRLKALIASRYHTRIHMSLILSSCGLTAMLASWFLLHYGVHSMLVRYPVAIMLAYATFLIGVWTWLRATGFWHGSGAAPANARKSKSGGLDIDIPSGGGSGGGGGGGGAGGGGLFRGGGGSFDGGGASSSFAEGQSPVAVPVVQSNAASAGPKSGGGFGIFDGIDGDGIVLLLLAAALILVVFCTSGYLIYCAPDVLTEAAFGAALTGTLSRSAREHAEGGWVAGVVKKTWWPFALVLLAAVVFAGWSAAHYPAAATFRQAIAMAIHNA